MIPMAISIYNQSIIDPIDIFSKEKKQKTKLTVLAKGRGRGGGGWGGVRHRMRRIHDNHLRAASIHRIAGGGLRDGTGLKLHSFPHSFNKFINPGMLHIILIGVKPRF